MKAAVVTRFGAPSVLQIQDVPIPVPDDTEVLVKVRWIGLNFAEVFGRMGIYPGIPDPPFIPGIEFSGNIERVGRNVRSLKAGDRVMGFSRQGSYAEFVCTRESYVIRVPNGIPLKIAAALPVANLSAYHGLITLAYGRKGEKVLIHAAAGGVGLAAIQIAQHRGLKIYGTVGSEEKRTKALRDGAHLVVNYRTEDFATVITERTGGYGVDIVMDSVGGSVFRKSWRMLAPMGRYVLYGFAAVTGRGGLNRLTMYTEALKVPLIFPPSLPSRNVSLMGFNLYFLTEKTDYLRSAMRTVLSWYHKGIIRPFLGATYTLDEVSSAHGFLQSRKSIGKVVVRVA